MMAAIQRCHTSFCTPPCLHLKLHSSVMPEPSLSADERPARWIFSWQWIQDWFESRLPRSDQLTLTQRTIYILPSRAGWAFGLTLIILLLTSINYQLNLGYALTFLLAGAALVSMHVTHNTLRGLKLQLKPMQGVFAGQSAALHLVLDHDKPQQRFGIGLRWQNQAVEMSTWTNVPALGSCDVHLNLSMPRRGHHLLPTLRIECRFPLGLFTAWALWRPASRVWVYPTPEWPAPPLPGLSAIAPQNIRASASFTQESDGIRLYRRGDSLNQVVWKKSAQSIATGTDWISREPSQTSTPALVWLEFEACPQPTPEARLARLAAWLNSLETTPASLQQSYGLRLPGQEIQPGFGSTHQNQCLQALAVY
jgi:uncharacterized protein (DUF58 family)